MPAFDRADTSLRRDQDANIARAKERAAYRMRIGIITAVVLGTLSILIIVALLILRRRRRRKRKREALPVVLLTSPSSPHIWIVPPIPGVEPDQSRLVPPKTAPDGASGWEAAPERGGDASKGGR